MRKLPSRKAQANRSTPHSWPLSLSYCKDKLPRICRLGGPNISWWIHHVSLVNEKRNRAIRSFQPNLSAKNQMVDQPDKRSQKERTPEGAVAPTGIRTGPSLR